jgi:hypothetical protein
MTPKEKAEELVSKFTPHTKVFHEHLGWVNYLDSTKQCALIAIDEIIANIEPSVSMDVISARIKYWEQVKIEINKL